MGITVNELDVVLKAQTGQYEKGIRQAASGTKAFGKAVGRGVARAQLAIKGLGIAIRQVSQFIKGSIDASIKQAKAWRGLVQGLKNTGQASKQTLQEFKSLTRELQAATGVGDEVQLQAARTLTTFGLSAQEIQKALPALLDVNAVVGDVNGDLTSLANQLGKVLGQPERFASALARSGIIINKELLKGKSIEEQRLIVIEEINKQYGGQAEAVNAATGGVQNLVSTWGDLKETFGSGFLQGINVFVAQLQAILNSSDGFAKFGLIVGKSIGIIGQTALVAIKGIKALIDTFKNAKTIIGDRKAIKQAKEEFDDVSEEIEFLQELQFKIIKDSQEFKKINGELLNKQQRVAEVQKTINPLLKKQADLLATIEGKIPDNSRELNSLVSSLKSQILSLGKAEVATVDLLADIDTKLNDVNNTLTTTTNGAGDLETEFEKAARVVGEIESLLMNVANTIGLEVNEEAQKVADTLKGVGAAIGGVAGLIVAIVGTVFELVVGIVRATEDTEKLLGAWEDTALATSRAANEVDRYNKLLQVTKDLGLDITQESKALRDSIISILQLPGIIGEDGAITPEGTQIIRQQVDQLLIYEQQLKNLKDLSGTIDIVSGLGGDAINEADLAALDNYLNQLVNYGIITQDLANRARDEARGSFLGISSDISVVLEDINQALDTAINSTQTELDLYDQLIAANKDVLATLEREEQLRLDQIEDEQRKLAEEKLAAEKAINDQLKERLRLTRQLAAFVDTQNVVRAAQITAGFRGAGLAGAELNAALGQVGVAGSNVGDSIGTQINNTYVTGAPDIANANN